jgi:hypothetical protein
LFGFSFNMRPVSVRRLSQGTYTGFDSERLMSTAALGGAVSLER